jgi:hypothetical protein
MLYAGLATKGMDVMLRSCLIGMLALMPMLASAQALLSAPMSGEIVTIPPFHFRLPAGEWRLVFQTETKATMNGGGLSQIPIRQSLYMQMEGTKLAAFLVLGGSAVESGGGWAPPRICSRTDTYWSGHRNGWTNNFDCVLVNHVRMREGPKMTDLMRAAFTAAGRAGGMPHQMIRADFADAGPKNEVFAEVYLNAELAGMSPSAASWSDSEWHIGNLDTVHKAYLDKVVAWAAAYRTVVRSALP